MRPPERKTLFGRSEAALFDSLAASSPYRQGLLPLHDLLSNVCDSISDRATSGLSPRFSRRSATTTRCSHSPHTGSVCSLPFAPGEALCSVTAPRAYGAFGMSAPLVF